MNDVGVTTAAIISFSEKLEDRSSMFYEGLAERWTENVEVFLKFAEDGRKNRTQVVRTYQETISDALEASYSFEGLDLSEYEFDTVPVDYAGLVDDLEAAIALEEKACAFYLDVAERSESLLASIPRAFKRVAKKRSKRKDKLEAMLNKAKTGS